MRSGIKIESEEENVPSSEKYQGKILPGIQREQQVPTAPSLKDDRIPDWEIRNKPVSIDPERLINVDSIPDLFKSLERIMKGLSKLNAEFCIGSETMGEVWLVPAYTARNKKDRKEISFEDAAKLIVIVAGFNGEVKNMKFLDDEE